jgi:hypothetical protein
MPQLDLSDDQAHALKRYLRAKLDGERFPLWSAYNPIREVLAMLDPPKPRTDTFPTVKVYAPPRATAKQRRGRDPRDR